jgi:hypothetical protein
MSGWLDAGGRLFNPNPSVSVLPLPGGRPCVVLDDVLANPDGVAAWAATQAFVPPVGYPYPGLVLELAGNLVDHVAGLFDMHARARLGGRRTLDARLRLSLVTTPPERLEPRQWQCHRDRVADDPTAALYAASVLYLFRDPALGGTSFYRPRRPAAEMARMIVDSQQLDAEAFASRHGLQPGYMAGSNAYFERVASVPAAWNRMLVYDGAIFHSADVGRPQALDADPRRGRLTLNGFFTCKPNAR